MPFVQTLLLKFPAPVLCLLVVGVEMAFGFCGLLVVRLFFKPSLMKDHNDVADPLFGVLGTIYAVLIAFMVIIVWQQFDKSDLNAKTEANYLADMYRDAEAFPPAFRNELNPLVREYRDAVVKYEWKTMQRGEMSPEVEKLMNKIWGLYTTFKPRNITEQAFFDESVKKINSFRELRRQRIMDSREGIEPLLWFVLIVGGFIIISFTFLFGAENTAAHVIMVILLSAMIGIILFTIMELDFPFTGSIAITSNAFKNLILN